MPSKYAYKVVSGPKGTSLHGTVNTKREAEALKRDVKDRGSLYVKIKRMEVPKDEVDKILWGPRGRPKNPSNRTPLSKKSTPWIPVKAIRFRDGKLDLRVSKAVKRSMVGGARLGNPSGRVKRRQLDYDNWAIDKGDDVIGHIQYKNTWYYPSHFTTWGKAYPPKRKTLVAAQRSLVSAYNKYLKSIGR